MSYASLAALATGGGVSGGAGSLAFNPLDFGMNLLDSCGFQCMTAYPPLSGRGAERNACIAQCNQSKAPVTINQGPDLGTILLIGAGAILAIKLLK